MSTETPQTRKFYWWNRQGLNNFRALNGKTIQIITEVTSQEVRIVGRQEQRGEVVTVFYKNME